MKPIRLLPFLALLACAGTAGARPGEHGALVDGLWCGTGLIQEFSLQLAHGMDPEVNGTLRRRDRVRELVGRLDGNLLRTQTTKVGSLVLELRDNALRIVDGDGQLALARGMSFIRARDGSCSS